MLLETLLIIYVGLMTIDLLLMTALHFLHDRKGYYLTAAGLWAGYLISFLGDGVLAPTGLEIHHLFGISFMAVTTHCFAKLVQDIYQISMPRKKLLVFTVACWFVALALRFVFHASFLTVSSVVCIGIVPPILWAGIQVIRHRRASVIDLLFGMLLVAEGVHILDYPPLRQVESAAVFGFSFGLVLMHCASMLVPVVINRRLAADMTANLQRSVDLKAQELKEAHAQLFNSSKLASLGEIAGGIAHEINNPLGVILMRSSQLERMIGDPRFNPETARKLTSSLATTAERIAKIVNGLRTFSRDSDSDPTVETELAQIVADTLNLCSERIAHLGIRLTVGKVPPANVNCRPEQISQVLINLLNNAVDAVSSLDDRWIQLSFESSPRQVVIRVTDSGDGIDDEIEKRLFQPFFTTKAIGKGTGLGLSISKGIMESHGGQLAVDRSFPHTSFVVRMPLAA